MTETNEVGGLCTICSRPKEEHKNMVHQFSPYGQNSVLIQKSPEMPPPGTGGTVKVPTAGDPLLRMVLLRKGIIEVADLEAIEAELRATGVAGYAPPASLG